MKSGLLETKGICKSFRGSERPALEGVSVSVPEGSVYGLLGANGAGKSTLLKIITGMMRPDAGAVYFKGRPWSRANIREIGAMIETPPIYENLSAKENLIVRATALGLPADRLDGALERAGLAGTGRKKAGRFSTGMKQKLGIALALLSQPRFLVLDEPTNGLDPFGIQELRESLREFADQGITVLVSSHVLSEVEQVADEIGILTEGVLGYQGPLPPKGELEELFAEVTRKQRERGRSQR